VAAGLANGSVSRDVSFFGSVLGQRLAREDLAARGIFVILEQDFGLQLGHANLVIGAPLADARQACLLGIAQGGSALLHINRLTTDTQGVPLACEHLFRRGDAYHFRVGVDRERTPPSD
jgi:GntR family transcriptional regulator